MLVKQKHEEHPRNTKENVNKDEKKINAVKVKAKVEGGFTWYLTSISFILLGLMFKTSLFFIGFIAFIFIGIIKSYESYLYGKVIYYSCIDKDEKTKKEYENKLKSYPNSSKILEKIRVILRTS